MSTNSFRGQNFGISLAHIRLQRGLAFGVIIIAALLAFEIFNFSTTDFALRDLLGDLSFLGVQWATILSIAFCGIDFAGIARLFTPGTTQNEPTEVWYLFGAWLLAATMNAMLTWWGVSIAILSHSSLGNAVVERTTLLRIVPIFVAVMVWLIRVLIIGTFSMAGERLFSQSDTRTNVFNTARASSTRSLPARQLNTANNQITAAPARNTSGVTNSNTFRPAPKSNQVNEPVFSRPEPSYHPVSMSGQQHPNNSTRR